MDEVAERLLRDPPLLHRSRSGQEQLGGTNARVGRELLERLRDVPDPRIGETGSGLSTLLFLSVDPSLVLSISPDAELHARTRAEAEERGLPTAPLRFVDDRSERALPALALDEDVRLDAAFIDGNHGWPAVFVDFCYFHHMLVNGGLLFVDDVQIYAVRQLVALLRNHQPAYEFVSLVGKLATFRKTDETRFMPDWVLQPFIVMNTVDAAHRPAARSTDPGERSEQRRTK